MDRRPELRRAMTLKEQLSTPAEPAIRDFLRIPHDDDDDDDDDCPEETPCTLMDAIDRDLRGEGGAGGAINWKPLRHRLWLRRAAGAWHAPGSETKPSAAANRAAPRCSSKCNYSSGEASAAFSRALVDDEDGADVEVEAEDNGLPPPAAASTSLITLMEQADGHWDEAGEDGGASRRGAVGDDDEDGHGEGRHGGEEEEEEEEVQVCCVCMVRHKGAAFIPCGHTFCRLCSRELRHIRGNCPLCNVFIQDILHIF